jgi:hypothetical protein
MFSHIEVREREERERAMKIMRNQPHVRTVIPVCVCSCALWMCVLEGVLRDERTRWGIKILLEVPRSTKKLKGGREGREGGRRREGIRVVVDLVSSESLRSHFCSLPILAYRKSLSSVLIIAHSYIVSFN